MNLETYVAQQRKVLFAAILILLALLIALPVMAHYQNKPKPIPDLTKAGFSKDEVLIVARACTGEEQCVVTTRKGHRVHIHR